MGDDLIWSVGDNKMCASFEARRNSLKSKIVSTFPFIFRFGLSESIWKNVEYLYPDFTSYSLQNCSSMTNQKDYDSTNELRYIHTKSTNLYMKHWTYSHQIAW